MKFCPLPPLEEIVRALEYDPETGIFLWRDRPDLHPATNARLRGARAGCVYKSSGYVLIWLGGRGGRNYYAHRLAWKIIHGADPVHEIDHEDLDRANNRIKNLRPATDEQNGRNRSRNKGKELPKGVTEEGPSYRAQIKISGKIVYLGAFKTVADAHAAYSREAKAHFGEFARIV